MSGNAAPVRVLSLDGGGMRGLYTVSVLQALEQRFAKDTSHRALDIGSGFDIIVGTSTGGILAAGLAAGVGLSRVRSLYREWGPRIFRHPLPAFRPDLKVTKKTAFWLWLLRHLKRAGHRNEELRAALESIFGDETIGELYRRRGVGLCVPSTALAKHWPRVFKTAHLDKHDRDDDVSLVDVCMATSAAPIYLPLVSLPPSPGTRSVYADGGLWANNPVLIGLLEGLALSNPQQPLLLVSIGTCAPAAGSPPVDNLDRGVADWRAGVSALTLAIDAQGQAAQNSSTLLVAQLERLGKSVRLLRCEESRPSAQQTDLLELDSSSPDAMALMEDLGNHDGNATYRWCHLEGDERGTLLQEIFSRIPPLDRSTPRRIPR